MSVFQKATKRQLKARLALDGPTGAGKTYTALTWAGVLGKRIAVVDTERGSASLYSHLFDFDVLEMTPPFSPARLIEALQTAEGEGFDVVIVDSLSHFWEGEGGVLDIADAAGKRDGGGNSFAGWKVATPELRHLVDVMLGLQAHLVVTMRSKMEYVLEENERGKKVPRKVGMAPVMRQGVEYEFQLVGELDLDHRITITKSRCDLLADKVVGPGRAAEAAETYLRWLDAGEPMASRNDIDALVARMNQLPDEVRKGCKSAFVARFGSPDHLLASQVEAASEFVDEFATGEEAPQEPSSVDDDHTAAPSVETRGSEGLPTPATEPADPARVASIIERRDNLSPEFVEVIRPRWIAEIGVKAEHLTADKVDEAEALLAEIEAEQKAAWDKRRRRARAELTKAGVKDEADVDALILTATGGATSSTAQLTEAQLEAVLAQVKPLLEPAPDAA